LFSICYCKSREPASSDIALITTSVILETRYGGRGDGES
jgi:hypothetical protein